VSFILDALRKSEHERQRSAVPGLSQVPLATPQPHLPRWAVVLMGALGAGVLVLGGAWWQSTRGVREPSEPPAHTVERSIELPAAVTPRPAAPSSRAALGTPTSEVTSLADAAGSAPTRDHAAPVVPTPTAPPPTRLELPADAPALPRAAAPPVDEVALPSAAALAAEGVALPTLRLELHAFSGEPRDRFVFIHGRKYVEGERLVEGPELVTIAPTGAVLAHAGRQFLLVQE
jgi:general secretion pathway protein B